MNRTAGAGRNAQGDVLGQRSYVTVLFSDLCASTSLTAKLDADSYTELLEGIRNEGLAVIDLFGGQVAQVYGDGILSIFQGAGSAMRAVEAAAMVHKAVSALPPPPGATLDALKMHSGIHSGLVLLREGDAARGAIEAVGRATSVAARLSAAARADEILVTAGSLGPMRDLMSDGNGRLVDIGDGSAPVLALAVRHGPEKSGASHLMPGGQSAFVGRADQLQRCESWLDGLGAGTGFRAVLVAPPGQGKTRLSRRVEERAASRAIRVLRGTCAVATAVGPLQPFRQIAAALGDASDAAVDPDALVARIAGLLARQPLLLVLDDWQWADTASVAVLSAIRTLNGPLGILLLARDDEDSMVPLDGFAEIRLPPLTLAETTALVQSRRPEFDPLDAARIHARAGGNPLYVEEICLLDPRTARHMLPDGMEPAGIGWVASLVASRVRQLPAPVQAVLETAAVIGMAPPRWLLDELMGADTVDTALPALQAGDFLLRRPDDTRLAFKHGITWQIAYSLVPLASRRRLHAAIADVLERRHATPDLDLHEALAWHLLASDQPGRGWVLAAQAGDRAVALGSLDRARIQYRRALEAMARLPDAQVDRADYAKLVGKLGYVCVYDADAEHIPLFRAAIRRAAHWGDRATEAEANYWLGYVAHGSGNASLAIGHCRQALELSDLPSESAFKVQVRASLAQALAGAARYAEAIPLLDEAIAIKRASRSGRRASPGLAYTLAQRAAVAADMGRFDDGRAMLAEAIDTLRGESHPVEGSVLAWQAVICAWQGDWEGMVHAAERGCDIAQRMEAVYVHAISRAFGSYGRWQLDGDLAAVDALASAVDCMVNRGKTMALSIACGFLADAQTSCGNPEAARRAAVRSAVQARAGDLLGLAWSSRAWARHLAVHSPAKAGRFMARARRNAAQRQSPHELARCDFEEAQMALVPIAERQRLLLEAERAFEGLGMQRPASMARAALRDTETVAGARAGG